MKTNRGEKISITHWLTGQVLFEYESKGNTIKNTLEQAVSSGVNLRGVDLWGADLRGASLVGAKLVGAKLVGANLVGANLVGANLGRADLWGADLRGASLVGAKLGRADLRGANLGRADLRGAKLVGASLRGASLWGAKGLIMYWHLHHEALIESLTKPLKNRKDYIKQSKPKNEIKPRLKLIKKVKAKPQDYPISKSGWEKLHKIECSNCPWNGKTIFTKKNEYENPKK